MFALLKLHKLRQLINEALISIGPSVHDARHCAVHGAWQSAVQGAWQCAVRGTWQCTVHGFKQNAVHIAWQSVAFSLRTTSKHTLAITVLA